MAGVLNILIALGQGVDVESNGGGEVINSVDNVNFFDDNSGLFLLKFDNNAVDSSGAYTTTVQNITYSTGVFGGSAYFGGTGCVFTNFKMPALQAYTISTWSKLPTLLSGVHTIFGDINTTGTNASGRALIAFSNSKFYANMGNGVGYWYDDSSCDLIDIFDNKFHHIVLVVDGKSQKLYVDKILRYTYTSTISAGTAGSQNYIIGKLGQYNGGFLRGELDQMRFFKRTLLQEEINALYAETKK